MLSKEAITFKEGKLVIVDLNERGTLPEEVISLYRRCIMILFILVEN